MNILTTACTLYKIQTSVFQPKDSESKLPLIIYIRQSSYPVVKDNKKLFIYKYRMHIYCKVPSNDPVPLTL